MVSLISLTPSQPVVVAVATIGETRQSLDQAVDLCGAESIDLELVVLELSPSATLKSVRIGLATGFQTQSEDGWISNRSSPPLTFMPCGVGTHPRRFSRLFRFARWVVLPGLTGGTVTFYLRGVARGR